MWGMVVSACCYFSWGILKMIQTFLVALSALFYENTSLVTRIVSAGVEIVVLLFLTWSVWDSWMEHEGEPNSIESMFPIDILHRVGWTRSLLDRYRSRTDPKSEAGTSIWHNLLAKLSIPKQRAKVETTQSATLSGTQV
jgi:hypothetical protein